MQLVIFGVMLVVVMIVAPRGLVDEVGDVARRLLQRRRRGRIGPAVTQPREVESIR
jgi:hypothetical protein